MPLLIFLNPGEEQCLANRRSRPWEQHKFPSRQGQDAHLACLLPWVCEYYRRDGHLSLAGHGASYAAYAGPKIELKARCDLDASSLGKGLIPARSLPDPNLGSAGHRLVGPARRASRREP